MENKITSAFRTGSFIRPMEMRNRIPGIWQIGIDIGYSSVKTATENGIACIPSHIKPVDEKDLVFRAPESTDVLYRDENGKTWAVGALAYEIGDSPDEIESETANYGRSWYDTRRYRILADVGTGVALSANQFGGPEKEDAVEIITGLPPQYKETEDTESVKNVFHDDGDVHEFSLKIGGADTWKRFRYRVEEKNVSVISQPLGAAYCVSFRLDGSQTPFAREIFGKGNKSGVCDGGFKTLDFYGIQSGIPNSDETGTYPNRGMHEILSRTCAEIKTKYGKAIQIHQMQNILYDGMISVTDKKNFSRKTYSIQDILIKNAGDVFEDAVADMATLTKYFEGYNLLIGAGGVYEAWEEMLNKKLSQMGIRIIPANYNVPDIPNTMANALGYYLCLSYVANRKKRKEANG